MKQMTPRAVKQLLDENNSVVLIDVRESHELVNGVIVGAKPIPMNTIPEQVDALMQYKDDTVVLICRSGKRSMQVGEYLEQFDFSGIVNLSGGMNAWAVEVDTSMTVY